MPLCQARLSAYPARTLVIIASLSSLLHRPTTRLHQKPAPDRQLPPSIRVREPQSTRRSGIPQEAVARALVVRTRRAAFRVHASLAACAGIPAVRQALGLVRVPLRLANAVAVRFADEVCGGAFDVLGSCCLCGTAGDGADGCALSAVGAGLLCHCRRNGYFCRGGRRGWTGCICRLSDVDGRRAGCDRRCLSPGGQGRCSDQICRQPLQTIDFERFAGQHSHRLAESMGEHAGERTLALLDWRAVSCDRRPLRYVGAVRAGVNGLDSIGRYSSR